MDKKLSSASPLYFGPYRGIVETVHDGDTIDIRLDLGFDLTVYARCRVIGINAPELSTSAGKTARDFAKDVLSVGAGVEVTSYGWDKYGGRIDAAISMDTPFTWGGKNYADFGQLMLDSGNAIPFIVK